MPVSQETELQTRTGGVDNGMPVLVQNMQPGPTVFSDHASGIEIEWRGADDPDGEDHQQVPRALLRHPNFVKNISRGVFKIIDPDQDVEAILNRQVSGWRNRRDQAERAAAALIDPAADNDLISMPCVGPGQRPGTTCGVGVPMREKQAEEFPALCDSHKQLKNQFVLAEGEFDNSTGKPRRRWVLPTAGSPLPSQADV